MTRATWCAALLLLALGGRVTPAAAQDESDPSADESGPADEDETAPEVQDDPDTPLDESSQVDEADSPGDGGDEEGGEADDERSDGRDDDLEEPGETIVYQEPEPPPGDDAFNLILPPFVYDRRAGTETIALFPLFYSRSNAESQELLIPPYYLQRGTNNWDVLFPLFWWYRGAGHHTWILPFVHSHQAPDGFDFGVSPFVYAGRHDDHHYTLIPPLLFFDWGVDDEERFTFAALFWRIQEQRQEHWGIFPVLWVENTESSSYIIQPPLFFRFEDYDAGTTLTVIPPFYHRDEPTGSYFGLPPLFHHNSGPGHTSTTIFPLLSHFSEEPDVMRLTVLGAFWYWRDHGDETLVTPLYQRFRGATEMDSVAPFFFHVRDPRDGSSTLAIPPLIWNVENPSSIATVVFPFFGRFEERGRSETWVTPLVGNHLDRTNCNEEGRCAETTWVFPTLQVSRWTDGDAVNLHPLFYYESVADHRFSVFFPLWFDFEWFGGDNNRYTVAFPFFWRVREGHTTSTLATILYHRERERSDESSDWEFHIFPLLSWGGNSEGDHWWKFLYGLFGFERRGPRGYTTLSYITFQTGGPAPLGTE